MTPDDVNRRGAEDLAHIADPRGQAHQMEFRTVYMQTLKELYEADPNVPPGVVVHEATRRIRVQHPDFKPMYDPDYFKWPPDDNAETQ